MYTKISNADMLYVEKPVFALLGKKFSNPGGNFFIIFKYVVEQVEFYNISKFY